jgi:hypothetical protein
MSESSVTAKDLIEAFDLPAGPSVRRVPKTTLSDHLPTSADKRLVDSKLARLEWIAAINPATAGIGAVEAHGLTIRTINFLLARSRGPMPARLIELIHRAIPQPVVLVHADEAPDAPASLSLAQKRAAEREAGRMVLTDILDTGPLAPRAEAFLASLSLSLLPSRDLAALYRGLMDRVEALAAARKAARPFRLASSRQEQQTWHDALELCWDLELRIASLSAAMRKEPRLAARVERGEEVRQLKSRLSDAVTRLA